MYKSDHNDQSDHNTMLGSSLIEHILPIPQKYPLASTPAGAPTADHHRGKLNSSQVSLNPSSGRVRSLSPISVSDSFRIPIQYTGLRAGAGSRQRFSDDSLYNESFMSENRRNGNIDSYLLDSSKNSESDVLREPRRSVYPYPVASKPDDMEVDLGELFYNQLRILASFKKLEAHKLRLMPKNGKEKEKAEDKAYTPEFTKETFLAVNTEASIYVLYLIFNTLDPKETEERFRDCNWPHHDKKTQSAFRRLALEWMKELLLKNPEFFIDLKIEILPGILVSPGGYRFISTMIQFCRFALYTLANRKKGVIRQQILLPPKISHDPEADNRKLHILNMRIMRHSEAAFENWKTLIVNEELSRDQLRRVQFLKTHLKEVQQSCHASVVKICGNYPNLFGTISEEELNQRAFNLTDSSIDQMFENDFVASKLMQELQRKAEEIYKPVSRLQEFLEDFSKLWYILDMDKSEPLTLDCSKIIPTQIRNTNGDFVLNNFFAMLRTTIDGLLTNKYLHAQLPENVREDFELIKLRTDFIDMLQKQVNESSNVTPKTVQKLKLKRDKLKLRLNNYDWSKVSKIQDFGNNKLLEITPIRVFDINKPSGRTPGINSFLETTPSLCDHQTSVVKRRETNLKSRKLHAGNNVTSEFARNVNISVSDGSQESESFNSKSEIYNSYTPVSSQSRSRMLTLPLTPVPESTSVVTSGRKSVSFQETSWRESSSLEDSKSQSTTKTPSSLSSSTPKQSYHSRKSSEINTRGISKAPKADSTPGLDDSTRGRVDKLLQSIQSNCQNECGSQSPVNNKLHDEINFSSNSSQDTEDLFGVNILSQMEHRQSGNFSIAKGIMETSHIELFSDSDE